MHVLIFAFILSLCYLISYYRLSARCNHMLIKSFSAGMFVFGIFSDLLPYLFINGTNHQDPKLLSSLLVLGFVLYHILDLYLHKNIRNKKRKLFDGLHSFGFFIDNFVKGFMLVITFSLFDNFVFFFIPFVFLAISEGISFSRCSSRVFSFPFVVFASLFYPIGAFFAASFGDSQINALLALISGAFIYFILRDEFPKERNESLLFFVGGVIVMFIFQSLASF